jgi:hypothetical protein
LFSCFGDKPSAFWLDFRLQEELAAILDSHAPCKSDALRHYFNSA